jgi:hypothetical protein
MCVVSGKRCESLGYDSGCALARCSTEERLTCCCSEEKNKTDNASQPEPSCIQRGKKILALGKRHGSHKNVRDP